MSDTAPPVAAAPASCADLKKDEQAPVATAPAASTSRADRKCGRKTSNDAVWGSATDSGDKFIACLRQDDELLDFFNMQTDGGDSSYFYDALEGDDFDKKKIKDIFVSLNDSSDWAATFRALDSIRVVALLMPKLLVGHETEVCRALLPLITNLRSALQRNSLLTVSTLFSKAVAIAPRSCDPDLPFAELLHRIVRIAASHDKGFMRKVAKGVLKVVIQHTPSEGVARAVAQPSNLQHKNMAVVLESAACFFGCAKFAAKKPAPQDAHTGAANMLSSWKFCGKELGLSHILALIFKSKYPKVKKIALKVVTCLRQHHSRAATVKATLAGEGEWCLSASEIEELFCQQLKKRKSRRAPFGNVANKKRRPFGKKNMLLAKKSADVMPTSSDAVAAEAGHTTADNGVKAAEDSVVKADVCILGK